MQPIVTVSLNLKPLPVNFRSLEVFQILFGILDLWEVVFLFMHVELRSAAVQSRGACFWDDLGFLLKAFKAIQSLTGQLIQIRYI